MRFFNARPIGPLAMAFVVALTASSITSAARVEFNPSIVLSAGYADNINYSGVVSTSDSNVALGFFLPLTKRFPRGVTFGVVNASYIKQENSDSLDRFNYGGGFGVSTTPSSTANLTFTANYLHTQAQGDPQTLDDSEIFLTRRSQRDVGTIRVGFGQQLSRTWTWSADVSAATQRNELILDFDTSTVPDTELFEDKDQYGLGLTLTNQLSSRTGLGGSIKRSRYELELSGEQDTTSALINLDHKLNALSSLNFSVGAFENTGTAAGGTGTDSKTSGIQYNGFYNRILQSTTMSIGVTRVPGSGGNVRGTATQTTATLGFAGTETRYWNWAALLKYGLREANNPVDPDRQSTALNMKLERLFANQLGFNSALTLVRQSIDGNSQPDSNSFIASVGLVWYPRGRQAAGGS